MSVLDEITARFEGRDPGSICEPLKPLKQAPRCTCPKQTSRALLGGQRAVIDRSTMTLCCVTCGKVIDKSQRSARINHLRQLLRTPEHIDWADAADAGLLL